MFNNKSPKDLLMADEAKYMGLKISSLDNSKGKLK
jgi:hypothetical protein